MKKINVLDLFSGIGGFTLGMESTGYYETIAFCEIDKFCQKVLNKHWPYVPIIEDIHDVTNETLEQCGVGQVDLITAGFPCQPFSVAGHRKGTQDERFLWPELFRVITDIKPRFVILENVPNLLRIQNGLVFTGILYDLARTGYDAEWQIIPASAIGAPHKRERLFVVAYTHSERCERLYSQYSIFNKSPQKQTKVFNSALLSSGFSGLPQPGVFGGNNGLSNRAHRTRGLGNAVVPQVIAYIGNSLYEYFASLSIS